MKKIIPLLSKVKYILREEGLWSVLIRSLRYGTTIAWRNMRNQKADLDQWAALKDKYKGKRAFILGNGPSLNDTELYLLKDEFVICFNRFNLMLERLGWTPTAYAVADDRVLLDNVEEINQFKDLFEYSFFPDIHVSAPLFTDFKKLLTPGDNMYWFYPDKAVFTDNLPFCGMNKTVTNVAIQIFNHFGFSEIYLLGLDHNYGIPESSKIKNQRDIEASEDNDDNHFDPRYFGKGKKYHVPHLEETENKYKEAREFSKHNGFEIFNATVGGKLEVFERRALDDVLMFDKDKKKQLFIENVNNRIDKKEIDVMEIVRRLDVDVLQDSIHPNYTIIDKDQLTASLKTTVETHVPFGPYNDRYVLINRNFYKSDLAEAGREHIETEVEANK